MNVLYMCADKNTVIPFLKISTPLSGYANIRFYPSQLFNIFITDHLTGFSFINPSYYPFLQREREREEEGEGERERGRKREKEGEGERRREREGEKERERRRISLMRHFKAKVSLRRIGSDDRVLHRTLVYDTHLVLDGRRG